MYDPNKSGDYKIGQKVKQYYTIDIPTNELLYLKTKSQRKKGMSGFMNFGMKVFCNHPDVLNFGLSPVNGLKVPPNKFYGKDIACEFQLR